ncbi:CRISPR-associated endonuclease Cas2 (plasmid) [Sphaerotilus sulfidivorans]
MSTPLRHLYLAAYDIRDNRCRAGALKLLRGFATGGQKSVHEIWLTEAEKRRVLEQIVLAHRRGHRPLLPAAARPSPAHPGARHGRGPG